MSRIACIGQRGWLTASLSIMWRSTLRCFNVLGIRGTVGADLRVRPNPKPGAHIGVRPNRKQGAHIGAPLQGMVGCGPAVEDLIQERLDGSKCISGRQHLFS